MKSIQKKALTIALCAVLNGIFACNKSENGNIDPAMEIKIPTQGNSWVFIDPNSPSQQVHDFTNNNWTHSSQIIRTYFWIEEVGTMHIGIRAMANVGNPKLKAAFNNHTKEFEISSLSYTNIYIGTFEINTPGYHYIDISGVSKTGKTFGSISDILLGGSATSQGVKYVSEDYFYWGRRGPSVHLAYPVPEEASEVKWFYNEITVPEGSDVIGSFYMANGHSQGYFGMQVNSAKERRVLLSVWSPYTTDNPNEIPEEYRVELLKKGDNVVAQAFGDEGSGGQSYLRYSWIAGTTYKFLLKIEPTEGHENKTDYTGYFYGPETDEWQLIASWRRPFTNTYAEGLHSFLENFDTRTGPLSRKAHFGNQWVCDTNGQWHELTYAQFSADATAKAKARLDYAGGLTSNNKMFFLKNCGFFSQSTTINSSVKREENGTPPIIDFELLD